MITSFAACGEIPPDAVKIGVLPELVLSDDPGIVCYGDIKSLGKAAFNHEIDEIGSIPECVARYMIDSFEDMKLQKKSTIAVNKISFNLAVLKDRSKVFEDLEQSIEALNDRGILERLQKEYIDSYFETGELPTAPQFPKYSNGKRIKIAVTGCYPLIDSFSSNGLAEGLTRAVLSEVANVRRLNIELYVIGADSRMSALENKSVDAVICTTGYTYTGGHVISTSNMPDNISITMPFFSDNSINLISK